MQRPKVEVGRAADRLRRIRTPLLRHLVESPGLPRDVGIVGRSEAAFVVEEPLKINASLQHEFFSSVAALISQCFRLASSRVDPQVLSGHSADVAEGAVLVVGVDDEDGEVGVGAETDVEVAAAFRCRRIVRVFQVTQGVCVAFFSAKMKL